MVFPPEGSEKSILSCISVELTAVVFKYTSHGHIRAKCELSSSSANGESC